MSHTALLIGLDRPEVQELSSRLSQRIISTEMLPKLRILSGQLEALRSDRYEWVAISAVVFHGIFEDDLPTLAALSLWDGPCLPNAIGMLDCRPRIANFAKCRRVSRFAIVPRSYGERNVTVSFDQPMVAKFGEWHCGEGKEQFTGERVCPEPTLIEPFLEGEAVRIQLIGDRYWQIRLGGTDWKKSIHGEGASITSVNQELVEDCRKLADHFSLDVCAADYIIATDGTPHLLELNHIPNVTEFPEIRDAYLEYAASWLNQMLGTHA